MTPLLPNSDPYARLPELYDLEHEDLTVDRDLWLSFATAIGDPILEMGCGTGRLAIPLAEAGFDVTGLDASQPMLERGRAMAAHSHGRDRLTWHLGDMTDADRAPGGPFGIVLYTLNAIMHLPTSDQQRRSLQSTFRALDPRGQVIIDSLNPSPAHLMALDGHMILEGRWTLDDGSAVDKWSWRTVRTAEQIIETVLMYDHVSPDGRLTRQQTGFELRYVHPSELVLMLELAGFCDFQLYGSYDLEPFGDDSDRLIITAEVTPSTTGIR